MFSQALSGITKAIVVFVISSILANFLFGFNILVIGVISLLLYGLNLIIFAISLGMIILGLIFRFGTRIQAFAWGLLPIFQPLTAAFYPLSVLPQFLQIPALLLPPTYVFEALRANMNNPGVIQWNYIGLSFIENVFYFIFAIIFLNLMLDKSKISGQFARLES